MNKLKSFVATLLVAIAVVLGFMFYAESRNLAGVVMGPTPISELMADENPDMLYEGEGYFNVAIRDRRTDKDTIVHAVNTFPRKKIFPGQRVLVSKFMNGGEYLIKR